jgi:cysteine sulfinate desulfinase/cysteine desulfurase-like protein
MYSYYVKNTQGLLHVDASMKVGRQELNWEGKQIYDSASSSEFKKKSQ